MLGPAVVMLVVVAGIFYAVRAFFGGSDSALQSRGSRMVTCPETKKAALVAIAPGTMSNNGYRILDRLRIEQCSSWPVSQDCNQECLKQF